MSGPNFLANSETKIPPRADEVEVSVFGRGYGECIVLCSGHDEYIVIDSFRDPDTSVPVAIEYLQNMGVPASNIKEVVVTHWHRDHINGIFEILNKAAPDVKVVLNPIVREAKFNQFVFRGQAEDNESLSEFCKVYDFVKQHHNIVLASSCKRIYSNEISVDMFSLSPQDFEVLDYVDHLRIPDENSKTTYTFPSDNLLSIVILVRIQNTGILLGGDMENRSDPLAGWNAILKNYFYPGTNVSVFKVPHHGSVTGHNDEVWSRILAKKPCSIISRFSGKTKLPTKDDIKRIGDLSDKTFVVGNVRKLPGELERKLRKSNSVKNFYSQESNIGFVRYRQKLDGTSVCFDSFGAVEVY